MFHIHDAVTSKHPNRSNTLRQVLQSYWWPDAEEWVTKYVDNCEQYHDKLPTIRTASPTTPSLRSKIHEAQKLHCTTLEEWKSTHLIKKLDDWVKEGRLVIPPE